MRSRRCTTRGGCGCGAGGSITGSSAGAWSTGTGWGTGSGAGAGHSTGTGQSGGVIIGDWGEAVAALERADAISPETCRAYAEERFKPERMVADYLAAYETLLAR